MPRNERATRRAVRSHFKGLKFPDLALAQRELGDMLADRLATNPAKARAEVAAFDEENGVELIRLKI